MSDQSDEGQSVALGVAGLALALVVAGVLALAIWQGQGRKASTPAAGATMAMAPAATGGAAAAPATTAPAMAAPAAADVERLYFDVGSANLPADAAEVVKRVAEQARAKTNAMVRISGFHDASGDPARNAELAKNRALAVRDALLAQGVAEAALVMSKPEVTAGGADAREARRVELRLQ